MDMLRFSMASASGCEYFGRKFRTNILKFSLSRRCDSVAIVSNTIDDLPEPETPVKMVIFRLGMRNETFFKLFSRAPRISMYSWGMNSLLELFGVQFYQLLQNSFQLGLIGPDILHVGKISHTPVHIIPLQ